MPVWSVFDRQVQRKHPFFTDGFEAPWDPLRVP